MSAAPAKEGGTCLAVESPDSALLIGRKGRNLNALQYLINRMVPAERGSGETAERLLVDIEGYYERRRQSLEEMANHLAQRAKETGKEVRVKPLNPQERRIVHLVLEDDPDVQTFSLGNAALRSVVISPATGGQRPGDARPRPSRGGRRRRHGNGQGRARPEQGTEES